MDSLQQRIEGESAVTWDDNLSIHHKIPWLELTNSLHQLWKISGHPATGLRLEIYLLLVPKNQTPKAIPLRLVLPIGADLVAIPRRQDVATSFGPARLAVIGVQRAKQFGIDIGLFLLGALMFVATYNDVLHLIRQWNHLE
jgi:hypothetical protein